MLAQLAAELGPVALVSSDLPLRANLTAAENIALGRALRDKVTLLQALPQALALLGEMGLEEVAQKRDDALSEEQRFGVKLARALLLGASAVVIDRPVRMLPDLDYPAFMLPLLERMRHRCAQFVIVEYAWYAPLYEKLT